MKKLFSILFACVLTLSLPLCVFASETPYWYPDDTSTFENFHNDGYPKVVDDAGIFTDSEISDLEARCENIADTYGRDCVIYTDSADYGTDHDQLAYDFYTYNGYGVGDDYSGSVIYICMNSEHRHYSFAGTGSAESYFKSGNTDGIIDDIQSDMENGYYYDAMVTYLGDVETMYSGKISSGNWSFIIIASAVVGVIVGAVVLYILYKGMKKVHIATEANDYIVPGSFKVRRSRDYYLYSTVTRVRRDDDNHSSGSSGGRSFSGGGHDF